MKKNAQTEGVESGRGGGASVPILNGVHRDVALRTCHLSRETQRAAGESPAREATGQQGTASPGKRDDIGR